MKTIALPQGATQFVAGGGRDVDISKLTLELPINLPRPRNRHAADFQEHVGRLDRAIRGEHHTKTTQGEVTT